jgi:hypothetical protein
VISFANCPVDVGQDWFAPVTYVDVFKICEDGGGGWFDVTGFDFRENVVGWD